LALELDPRSVPALDAEASLLGRLGRFEESAALFSTLVALRPSSAFARVGEATALIYAQKHAEARDRLEEGLVAMPGDINLRDVLARHLAASPDLSVRDGERAVELARGIYQEFQTPESIETLAMALAQDGSFEEAVEWQQRLLERVRELATAEDRRRLELNLERYRRSEACCADL
jgi:tetratricopeptide (TPR) repeat protein